MRAPNLLSLLLLLAIPIVGWPRSPPSLGPPLPRTVCPVWVERPGGVACLPLQTDLRSGDRVGDGGRGRMSPARLQALAAPVDLNRASLEELTSLDGVGPKLAERIIAARPFASVDEIGRVRGIGAVRLTRLRERLSVSLDD